MPWENVSTKTSPWGQTFGYLNVLSNLQSKAVILLQLTFDCAVFMLNIA